MRGRGGELSIAGQGSLEGRRGAMREQSGGKGRREKGQQDKERMYNVKACAKIMPGEYVSAGE